MKPDASYDSIKLELADAIRGLMELARQRQHSEDIGRAQQLLARLAEDRFQLLVVGRFNGGKSSLMNAILGQPLLPIGVRPLTSVITSVCYGSRSGIEVHFQRGGLPAHGAIADLTRYATEDGNPANEKGVQSVIVQAPIEKLRKGFYFVDTPGIGSDIAANSATTERFLPDADAVIFVTSFDSPMQTEETDFLGRVREYAGKIFYVVNKSDLVGKAERARILDNVRSRLQPHAGEPEGARIFVVSARDALAAKLRGSVGDLTVSGLPELESALWTFLTEAKSREFLTGVYSRAERLQEAERFYVRIGKAGQLNGEARDARQRFESGTHEISSRGRTLLESATAKIRTELPSMLDAELKRWAEGIVSEFSERGSAGPRGQYESGPALVEAWKSWVEHQSRSLASLLMKIAGPDIQEMLRLQDTAKTTAASLFGAGGISFSLPASAELLERTRIVFTAAPEPPEGSSFPWWNTALSLKWARNFARRAWLRTAEEAVRAYAEEARRRTVEAALDWIERLFREASSRFDAEVASLMLALESKTAVADGLNSRSAGAVAPKCARGNRPCSRPRSAATGLLTRRWQREADAVPRLRPPCGGGERVPEQGTIHARYRFPAAGPSRAGGRFLYSARVAIRVGRVATGTVPGVCPRSRCQSVRTPRRRRGRSRRPDARRGGSIARSAWMPGLPFHCGARTQDCAGYCRPSCGQGRPISSRALHPSLAQYPRSWIAAGDRARTGCSRSGSLGEMRSGHENVRVEARCNTAGVGYRGRAKRVLSRAGLGRRRANDCASVDNAAIASIVRTSSWHRYAAERT
jgi:GTP-binding protein EngB required for normal cell division